MRCLEKNQSGQARGKFAGLRWFLLLGCIAVCSLGVVNVVEADSILGVPVDGFGVALSDSGDFSFNAVTGEIDFYIPFSVAASGNLADGAGTVSDTSDGVGGSLTMLLSFSPVVLPVATGIITFDFIDLDLVPGGHRIG